MEDTPNYLSYMLFETFFNVPKYHTIHQLVINSYYPINLRDFTVPLKHKYSQGNKFKETYFKFKANFIAYRK